MSNRSGYRDAYDYAAHWRTREWGPVQRRRGGEHPLRAIFRAGAITHDMGIRWLKEKLYIGEGIASVEEIHPRDVHWLLDMAEDTFSMEWIEALRERWTRMDAKGIAALIDAYEKKLQKSG